MAIFSTLNHQTDQPLHSTHITPRVCVECSLNSHQNLVKCAFWIGIVCLRNRAHLQFVSLAADIFRTDTYACMDENNKY